jgi:hypothetical protein
MQLRRIGRITHEPRGGQEIRPPSRRDPAEDSDFPATKRAMAAVRARQAHPGGRAAGARGEAGGAGTELPLPLIAAKTVEIGGVATGNLRIA